MSLKRFSLILDRRTLSFLPLLWFDDIELGLQPKQIESTYYLVIAFVLIFSTLKIAHYRKIMYFYTGAVKAAFMEELLFRGAIYGLTYALTQNEVIGVIVSFVSFGLWHLKNISWIGYERTILQVLYTGLIAGPILGWLRILTGDIYLSVLAHLVLNLVVVFLPQWVRSQKLGDLDYE